MRKMENVKLRKLRNCEVWVARPYPTNPSHPSRYRYSFVKVLSGNTSGIISLYHHRLLVVH